ncbi:MAG: hypothetical protein HGA45_06775 [Chloroflexales bacterium]|nr:hypothetical protein [Chloroflexales bacterium]
MPELTTPPAHQHPLRPLAALALIVAGLALALLLVLALRDALDPLARAEREAAYWRAEQLNDQLAPLDVIVAPGWRLLPLALAAGAGAIALLVAYRRWGGHEYIRAEHVTRALEAIYRHPTVPQTLSYSSHYAPHLRVPAAALPGEEVTATRPVAVPTFAQILAGGRVGRGNPLLLGFDTETGAELVGSWLDLYSTAVSGMPGSGKTTSQRFLGSPHRGPQHLGPSPYPGPALGGCPRHCQRHTRYRKTC